jgi:hypothetical protein
MAGPGAERGAIWLIGLVAGLALIGIGALYVVAPETGLRITAHEPGQLLLVMGGRYAFLGVMLIAALIHGSCPVLAGLCAGLAGLAFVDAAIYWGADPLPHLAAGLAASAAAVYFFTRRKADV